MDDGDCAHVLENDSNCLGCNNSWDTHCPRCTNTTTHYLFNGHCYEKGVAVPGYYWSSSSYLYRCNSGCKVCTNNSSNQCSECLEFHSLLLQTTGGTLGNCLTTCPTGYSSVNKVCILCHTSCKECSAENDASACTSCNSPNVLTPLPDRICDPNGCPDGYYIAEGSVCVACDTDYCLTCYGPEINNCLSCESGKFLKADTSECVVSCSSNYYYNGNACYPCDTSCATCDNPTKTSCLTCHSGYLLQVDKSCDTSCASGTFQESGTSTCVSCANLCDSCTSQAKEDCTACNGVALMLTDNSCVGNCTVNWY